MGAVGERSVDRRLMPHGRQADVDEFDRRMRANRPPQILKLGFHTRHSILGGQRCGPRLVSVDHGGQLKHLRQSGIRGDMLGTDTTPDDGDTDRLA